VRTHPLLVAALSLVLGGVVAALPTRAAADSCTECHSMSDDPRVSGPVKGFAHDIHLQRGLGCASCHGGDPEAQDESAMDPAKGFKGAPTRNQVAAMCAGCHANAAFMKHYNPRPYIFSVDEWKTSVHCKKEAEGDQKVATCTNCHGVHGILSPKDPASPVYPTNVPRTCAKCHNPEYMKGRTVRTDQFALYKTSVHGLALLGNGDVSAPACNDCHGNHGAAPPGMKDVAMVCGSCHGREAELFGASRMKAAMDRDGKPGCVVCHSNHGIQRPTDAMLSADKGGTCAGCHVAGSKSERAAQRIITGYRGLKADIARADSVLQLAETRGMEISRARAAYKESADKMVGIRAGLHAFDSTQVVGSIAEGEGLARDANDRAMAALRDWKNRRIGMAASLGAILVVIALLVSRIRGLGPVGEDAPHA
jgi:predicted CXXCH cytochrome family protein